MEEFKIKLSEFKEEKTKKLVVKALIVQKILIKHFKERAFINIFTDFPITEDRIVDVYYENIKSKEAFSFEIKVNVLKEWLIKTEKFYKDLSIPFIKTKKWFLVETRRLSDDLAILSKQIYDLVP